MNKKSNDDFRLRRLPRSPSGPVVRLPLLPLLPPLFSLMTPAARGFSYFFVADFDEVFFTEPPVEASWG